MILILICLDQPSLNPFEDCLSRRKTGYESYSYVTHVMLSTVEYFLIHSSILKLSLSSDSRAAVSLYDGSQPSSDLLVRQY